MAELQLFDCNASFGRRSVRLPGSPYKKEELLAKMDDYGIKRALVYHAMAKEYDPQQGNQILMKEILNEPRLVPAWAVLPHYTGEFPAPGELAREMQRQNVRAVTMFPAPGCQNFSVNELTCGALFSLLEERRIPLFLGLDQLGGSMAAAGAIACAHPALRLVLTNVTYRIGRDLYPLLEKCPNVFLETSGYKPLGGIAALCRRFGARRLLFGTGLPQLSGASAISLLAYSEIPEAEKQQIAGQNLERLLHDVRL